MIKFQLKFIGPICHPIIIVGERPDDHVTNFVLEAINDKTNIILTNVVNIPYPGKFVNDTRAGDGLLELIELIEIYEPRKIICLGTVAGDYVDSIKDKGCEVFTILNPSLINKSDRHIYLNQLSDALN